MLTVTPAARDYFGKLLEQQPDDTHLRLRVINPGTPSADVELTYCPDGQQDVDDLAIDCQSFVLYVEQTSAATLDGAMIDFESNSMGGELNIRAPGLKGRQPPADAPIEERVSWVLDARVNPMVASHGGQVGLVEVTADNDVVLRFGGGCQGCGMIDVTLKQGIETTLRQEVPEVREVIDATDHASGENPYY
ncbi:NifU family protein [Wenzhouxiangella sp. AB-CW3]|uniref:NifU family protein n=1 Tax=Wenzhouxiangella sp. AB-CW3 TaxID=2771012 RepID=UPI00168A6358|nr:NifU family protein [Wenzhouxiangella sp. AB-CW3]QOC21645.1 NifU family protein [Wenzhouxiangella sp. AB-CW3]